MDTFIERPQRNYVTGEFLKGHVPFNKGRKWGEWMDGRKQRKVLRIGMKNLRPRTDIGGINKKKVVMVTPEGKYYLFESATKAARLTGVLRENIGKCCRKQRTKAGGMKWYFWTDNEWVEEVNRYKEDQP